MYIGSISKQFCAAAILMLRDQGKLSLDDTLDVYFPEYASDTSITLKHLLTMRSGLPCDVSPMWQEPELYLDKSEAENRDFFLRWVLSQKPKSEPDARYDYANVNTQLLSYVVEIVSSQTYEDFVRQNIFNPLNMKHTGFVDEVKENPDWAKGVTNEKLLTSDLITNMTQGSGDIVTTADDFQRWMTALRSEQVLTPDSFREMTTNYTPEQPHIKGYGYCLQGGMQGGWGHGGTIGSYTSAAFFFPDSGYQIFVVTGNTPTSNPGFTSVVYTELMKTVFAAVDAASKK